MKCVGELEINWMSQVPTRKRYQSVNVLTGPWEAGVLGVLQHPRKKSGGAQHPLEIFMNPQNAWNFGEKAVI